MNGDMLILIPYFPDHVLTILVFYRVDFCTEGCCELRRSVEPSVADLMEFSCVRPLRTVYTLLEEAGGLALLDDPQVERATAEIIAGDRLRSEIQRDIKLKEKAREALARKYRSSSLSEVSSLPFLFLPLALRYWVWKT